jgi:hypothetical protein
MTEIETVSEANASPATRLSGIAERTSGQAVNA